MNRVYPASTSERVRFEGSCCSRERQPKKQRVVELMRPKASGGARRQTWRPLELVYHKGVIVYMAHIEEDLLRLRNRAKNMSPNQTIATVFITKGTYFLVAVQQEKQGGTKGSGLEGSNNGNVNSHLRLHTRSKGLSPGLQSLDDFVINGQVCPECNKHGRRNSDPSLSLRYWFVSREMEKTNRDWYFPSWIGKWCNINIARLVCQKYQYLTFPSN